MGRRVVEIHWYPLDKVASFHQDGNDPSRCLFDDILTALKAGADLFRSRVAFSVEFSVEDPLGRLTAKARPYQAGLGRQQVCGAASRRHYFRGF